MTLRQQLLRPRVPLVTSWLLLVLYAFPGYMNFDSGEQIFQARTGQFGDWHPPVMTAYWWFIDVMVHGPLGMLVLQSLLFIWGLYEVLRQRLSDVKAAWVAALLILFPPIFTPMAVVWKDAQMAGFLIAGLALALRSSRKARIAGVVLWFLAAGVRDNAFAALPLLVLCAVGQWGLRGRVRWLAAVGITVAIASSASCTNRLLTRRHEYPWYRSVALMDIVGTIRYADAISDDELRSTLMGTGFRADVDFQKVARASYTPRVWFEVTHEGAPVFVEPLDAASRQAIRKAWFKLVREHPGAYLQHRWAVMRELLGLGERPMWEPVPQSLAGNEHQLRRIGHDHRYTWFQLQLASMYRESLADGPLFRPWLYLVIAIVLLGDAILRRDRLLVALLGSALAYQMSFFVGAAAPDYRYSHWMVTCTCISIILAAIAKYRSRSPYRETKLS